MHMPQYRFEIDVPLSVSAVTERLKKLIAPERTFFEDLGRGLSWPTSADPPFLGAVVGHSFELMRDIRYKNSFLPIIRGAIAPFADGSRVQVSMSMHTGVIAFMGFFLLVLGMNALFATPSVHNVHAYEVPLGALALGLIIGIGAVFYWEVIKARRLLEDALSSAKSGG